MLGFGNHTEETAEQAAPAENSAEEIHSTAPHPVMPSIDSWISGIVFPFLDLIDIADVTARRKALLAMEKGKNEELITSIFQLADAHLFILSEFYKNTAPDDEVSMGGIKMYIEKSKAMKSWLGL